MPLLPARGPPPGRIIAFDSIIGECPFPTVQNRDGLPICKALRFPLTNPSARMHYVGMARMRLAGRRGQALESFWAGKVDAQHALAQMRGIPAKPAPLLPRDGAAERLLDARRSRANRRQFRCDISATAVEPRKCWLCDGLGQVVTAVAEEGRRRGLPVADGEVKAETCMACLGTGVER